MGVLPIPCMESLRMYFQVLDKPFHRRLLPVTFAMEEHVKSLELESLPAVKVEQAMVIQTGTGGLYNFTVYHQPIQCFG